MNFISTMIEKIQTLLPFSVSFLAVVIILFFANKLLRRLWEKDIEAQFRFQLTMLALSFLGVLIVVLALPISENLRGQLLALIGLLVSAAIALSSTTFIGNILAGIMLRVIGSARPGDFITINEHTGRITIMSLLYTEIQTEDRDLLTLPNFFIVSHPMKVVRKDGTIVSAEVSLGYDVPRSQVKTLLCEAAENAGLTDAFVQVRELGDYSVVYRVAGLLEKVTSLISARSHLREAMLDSLHLAGIEIVSPAFMNTRSIAQELKFIPKPGKPIRVNQNSVTAEDIAFDKAEAAASIEAVRTAIKLIEDELKTLEDESVDVNDARRQGLEMRKANLKARLERAEQSTSP